MINKNSIQSKSFLNALISAATNERSKGYALKVCISSFLIGSTCLGSVSAAEIKVLPYAVGDFEVSAQLETSLAYSDNAFRGSIVEESTAFFNVQPIIQAVNETASRRITFDYEGEGAVFFDSSDDNYLSTKLGAEYLVKLSVASELSFAVAYEDGNSIRGTEILEGTNASVDGPTEFENASFLANYSYNSGKVGPTLELGFEYSDLEFQNFSLFNNGRDRTLTDLSARLGYQISVATQVFIDLGYSDFDYDGTIQGFAGNLDNDQKKVEVGIKWRATKQTSGEISVGVIDKDFDNFSDPSSLTSWNAEIEWKATVRDVISFSSFSRPFEQSGTGLFIEVEEFGVTWDHQISPRWSVNTTLTTGSSDFEAAGRDDDYDKFQLGVSYQPTKFSLLSLDYEYEEKDSDNEIFDYEQNIISVTYSTAL